MSSSRRDYWNEIAQQLDAWYIRMTSLLINNHESKSKRKLYPIAFSCVDYGKLPVGMNTLVTDVDLPHIHLIIAVSKQHDRKFGAFASTPRVETDENGAARLCLDQSVFHAAAQDLLKSRQWGGNVNPLKACHIESVHVRVISPTRDDLLTVIRYCTKSVSYLRKSDADYMTNHFHWMPKVGDGPTYVPDVVTIEALKDDEFRKRTRIGALASQAGLTGGAAPFALETQRQQGTSNNENSKMRETRFSFAPPEAPS